MSDEISVDEAIMMAAESRTDDELIYSPWTEPLRVLAARVKELESACTSAGEAMTYRIDISDEELKEAAAELKAELLAERLQREKAQVHAERLQAKEKVREATWWLCRLDLSGESITAISDLIDAKVTLALLERGANPPR